MTEGGKNIKPLADVVRRRESGHYSHEAVLVLECKGPYPLTLIAYVRLSYLFIYPVLCKDES